MQSRFGRTLRVLSLAILVIALFATAAFAEREAPRAKPSKEPAASASQEQQKRQVVHHRVGKWKTVKQSVSVEYPFGGDNDCEAVCDDEICVCEEDWWDDGCCDFACDICWWILDET
jgi:Na+-transporting methylmalonyl-CoA/oxaloacetate decarboxylase gamma subunit